MTTPLALLTLAVAGLALAGWLPPEAAVVVAALWAGLAITAKRGRRR